MIKADVVNHTNLNHISFKGEPALKIAKVEPFPLYYRIPEPYGDANGIKTYRSSYMIRITTADGVTGWGECTDWLPTLHKGFQDQIIPDLIGNSALNRLQIVQTIQKRHARAASAVSMALTEIFAKTCGISICDLWGGAFRDVVPVYASFQSYHENPGWMQISLQNVEQAVSAGFRMIKVKVGGKSIQDDQQHIVKIQDAIGHSTGLILDANQSYDVAATLEWHSLLSGWSNVMWFEEPMPMQYAEHYTELKRHFTVPLAGGENLKTAAEFAPYLKGHCLDFVTPDPAHMTGIEKYRELLSMARNLNTRVTPHTYDGALSRLYAIFAQACLPPWSKMGSDSIEPVEWDVMDNPFTNVVPLQPANGAVTIPGGPGLGLAIDEELLTHYRWDGSSY